MNLLKIVRLFFLYSAAMLVSWPASALVIDTTALWDGNINAGWLGSGQSLTVDATENTLDSIGFYFDSDSFGLTFDFELRDALNGGTTFFSTSFVAGAGLNVIPVGQALTPGSLVYAQLDYKGFSGFTAHFMEYFNPDPYVGGNSTFGAIGSQIDFSGIPHVDHRFVAVFSGGAAVPEPSTLLLLGLGLAGLGFARRRRLNT